MSKSRASTDPGIWSSKVRAEYIDYLHFNKNLSKASVHSYCWRLETLFRALVAGKNVQGELEREELRNLLETYYEEAEKLVAQDDRRSHWRLLKEYLGFTGSDIMELKKSTGDATTPPPVITIDTSGTGIDCMIDLDDKSISSNKKSNGLRDKVWDLELKRDYRNWLKARGVKDRTCGSYCTFVHNLLRALADARPMTPSYSKPSSPVGEMDSGSEGGGLRSPPRREGLNRDELIQLLVEQHEEAQRLVRQSKKARYLRSFREFLGITKEERTVKVSMHWCDRIGGGYKKWVSMGHAGTSQVRTKGYVGAARSILKFVKKKGWVNESQGVVNVPRSEIYRAITDNREELTRACDKADEERLASLIRYLSAGGSHGDTTSYVSSDYEDDDEEDDDDEEKEEAEDDVTRTEELHQLLAGTDMEVLDVKRKRRSGNACAREKKLQKQIETLEIHCRDLTERLRQMEAENSNLKSMLPPELLLSSSSSSPLAVCVQANAPSIQDGSGTAQQEQHHSALPPCPNAPSAPHYLSLPLEHQHHIQEGEERTSEQDAALINHHQQQRDNLQDESPVHLVEQAASSLQNHHHPAPEISVVGHTEDTQRWEDSYGRHDDI